MALLLFQCVWIAPRSKASAKNLMIVGRPREISYPSRAFRRWQDVGRSVKSWKPKSSRIVPLGAPLTFGRILVAYFVEKRNTVCELNTAPGFSTVLGKFG